MKKHARIARFLSALFLCAVILPFAGSTGTAHAAEGISPAAYLTAEGYLNTPADFNGEFDLTHWQVSLDNEKGVQIQPLAATSGAWTAVDGGLNNSVQALIIDNGIIYAAGSFTNAGGDPKADKVAKYQNGAWSAVGGNSGDLSGTVYALVIDNGIIYAGGNFIDAGGDSNADHIAKYESGAWASLGGSGTDLNLDVYSLVMNGGALFAGGRFTNAGGDADADYIAKYRAGEGWTSLNGAGTGLNGTVYAILFDSGLIYAGGDFSNAGGDANADKIAKFNAGAGGWASLNGADTGLSGEVRAILIDGATIYAGGKFEDAGGDTNADFIAKYTTAGGWSTLGGASTVLSSWVYTLLMDGGVIFAGGDFHDAGGDLKADRIAKYRNGAWASLGDTSFNVAIKTLLVKDGVLYAGGGFTNLGGRIAQYGLLPVKPTNVNATDGTFSQHVRVTWNSTPLATAYQIYRYNGSTWMPRLVTSNLVYKDTSTTPLITYKYRVKACNQHGCSGFSTLDTGYRGKLVTAQLVTNLGFEIDSNNDGIPNFWTRASNNGLDKRICSPAAKHLGKCGYRLLGDGVAAKDWIRQNLSVKAINKGGGHNGDKLILSFYARSLRLELADGAYVLVKVRNSATNKQQVIRVNLTGTHAYKRFTKTLKVTIGNYNQVWVYVYANGTANENLYVDNVTVKLQYIQKK